MTKVIKTSNVKCGEYVQKRIPFKASNLEGKIRGAFYIVYSYAWYPIFAYNYDTQRWFENYHGYSPSTKRQINQARPESDITKLTFDEMKILLKEVTA